MGVAEDLKASPDLIIKKVGYGTKNMTKGAAMTHEEAVRSIELVGFEIGGLAGVVLGAAAHRVPIVIDGFISSAGALIATELAPLAREYIIPSHNSI